AARLNVASQLLKLILGFLIDRRHPRVNGALHVSHYTSTPIRCVDRSVYGLNRVKMRSMKKLPANVLDYFRKQGARGGKIGGKRSLETMTPEQRRARAKKASAAAAKARRLKTKPTREG